MPPSLKPTTVAQYFKALPPRTREVLERLRALVREAAPGATEKLGYGMPGFVLDGNLVFIAGYAHHVGLYGGRAMTLTGPAAKYQTGKGTLRFELDEPLPAALIRKVVKARVAETRAKAKAKRAAAARRKR